MVRQYALALLDFQLPNPMRFAEAYYTHYPKLGIGQWPPVFYLIEGGWTLLFGPSHRSVMLLLGLIVVAALWMVHQITSRLAGPVLALGAVALLLMRGTVVRFSYQVEPDMLLAVVSLAAALAFARYVSKPGWRNSLAWSALAVLAILIKGNAFALAFLPLVYVAISRRFDLLRRADFWAPGGVVGLLCGPWYWITRGIWTHTNTKLGTEFIWVNPVAVTRLHHFGLGLLAGGAAGMVIACGREGRCPRRRLADVMAALLVAWTAFHTLSPVGGGPRKHLLVLLLLAAFSMVSIRALSSWAGGKGIPPPLAAGCLTIGLALSFRSGLPGSSTKPRAMGAAAARIVDSKNLQRAAILVSSKGVGEGSLIAEMALRQPDPQHYILRASQLLAHGDWYDRRYELAVRTPAAVAELLDTVPVAAVVVDNRRGPRAVPHHELLEEMLRERPGEWELVGIFPGGPGQARVTACLYLRRGEIRPLARPPRIYSGTLGRYVSSR